jgi:pyruvate/2-oxoglutarate dehydrogenase complex dihydrolipoamide acyltransferase (E2) component
MYTNAQLNASIPALHDRFHFGLDLLEMDIVRAKAALRRDLNRIQAQRRAQEEAEAAERRKAEEAEEARKRAEEEAEARKKAAEEEERRRAEEEEEAARQRKEGEAAAERIRKQQEEARKVDPIVIQDDIPPLSAQQISAGGVSAEGTFDFWMEDAPAPDSATAQEFSMDMGFPGSSHSHPEIPGMSMEDPVPQAQGSFAEFMASMPMLGPPGDGNGGGMNGGENDHGDSVGDDGLSSYDDLFNFGL